MGILSLEEAGPCGLGAGLEAADVGCGMREGCCCGAVGGVTTVVGCGGVAVVLGGAGLEAAAAAVGSQLF